MQRFIRSFITVFIFSIISMHIHAGTNNINELQHLIINDVHTYYKDRTPSGVLLIAIDGKPFIQEAFGLADIRENMQTTINSKYAIGSITKQFTAVAILKALYQEELAKNKDATAEELSLAVQSALNKPVVSYLPPDHFIWFGIMPAWANTITLHNLLIHSSGLPNFTSSSDFDRTVQSDANTANLVKYLLQQPLKFKPGSKYEYSNSNYILLSLIVQQVAKQPFPEYLKEKFFIPLHMHSTSLPYGTITMLKHDVMHYKNLARGYDANVVLENPEISEVNNYELLDIAGGAGGMISTAPDLLKWNNALYNGRIIPMPILELMLQPYIECKNSYFDGYGYGYGLGMVQYENIGTAYEHKGIIPGYTSHMAYIPSLKISIISISNVNAGGTELKDATKEIKAKLPSLPKAEYQSQLQTKLSQKFPNYAVNVEKYEMNEFVPMLLQDLK